MNSISGYLILAVIWILLTSQFTLAGLFTGLILSLIVLGLTSKLNPRTFRPMVLKELLALILFFLYSVLRANISLAWDILWHRRRFSHAFFEVDCRHLAPWQAVILGNMISLTPGSLTLDADAQGQKLYVHTLYGEHVDLIQNQINELVQRMARLSSKPIKEVPT